MGGTNGDMGLVRQQPMELMPGTPDALVDVDSLDYLHRRIWETQERVLNGFVQYGTLLKATEAATRMKSLSDRPAPLVDS